MCYHPDMKKWNLTRICSLYQLLLVTVFLLAVSPSGYLNIAETKFAVYSGLTALFLAACLLLALRRDSRSYPAQKQADLVCILLACFWFWSLVSALCSPWRRTALLGGSRLDGLITLTLYCASFFALSLGSDGRGYGLRIPAAAALVFCGVAVLQFMDLNPLWLFPGDFRWSGRESSYNGAFLSLTGNADLTASVLSLGFAVFWSFGLKERKWVYLLPAVACFLTLLCSGIRGGLLAAAGGFLLCMPVQLRSGRTLKVCIYIAIAIVLLSTVLLIRFVPADGTLGELHSLLNGEVSDSFGSGRIYIWKNAWKLFRERPLLGGGPDTLGERGLFFSRLMADGTPMRRNIDCAHNEYLNILVNQGIPALLLFLAALGTTLFRAFRNDSAAAAVLRSALVTYLLGALFGISMPSNTAFFWLCWGMLEGALRRKDQKASSNRPFDKAPPPAL